MKSKVSLQLRDLVAQGIIQKKIEKNKKRTNFHTLMTILIIVGICNKIPLFNS